MKSITALIITGILLSSITGCNRKSTASNETSDYKPAIATEAGPPVIIYKTKANYDENIPVILSADKKEIISYPAITDIYYKGAFAVPTQLGNGFLLDRRGINENVAFLSMTYEEYSNFQETPDVKELMAAILDKDPLIEMYHCGSAYNFKNLEEELMSKVESLDFKEYTRIK